MREGRKLNRARELRRVSTFAERLLWEQLRDRRFEGLKFLRQQPLGPYVVDFVCREAKLVVEVDGPSHSESNQASSDAGRSLFIRERGLNVLRVRNEDVIDGIDGVLGQIGFAAGVFHAR